MDPCTFVRILIGNLTLRLPTSSSSNLSPLPCLCKIKLHGFPTQLVPVSLLRSQSSDGSSVIDSLGACFNLDKSQVGRILASSSRKVKTLAVEVYSGGDGGGCGLRDGKLLGRVTVVLDLSKAGSKACVLQNGWVDIGGKRKKGEEESTQFHLTVRAEPDPRYVFQFDGEPECSPQVFQVQGNVRQAVFTCKFSLRNQSDRNLGSRPSSLSEPSTSRSWLSSLGSDKDQPSKERKGWTITIHDLSGSPVAMASMVTPFVPSPGSDRVSKSNPGAWLIMRPALGTWKPWGRLEAWRNQRSNDLGYRFELLHDTIGASPATTNLVNSTISASKGGKFSIDLTNTVNTPICSPHSSCDFGSGAESGSWSGSEFGVGFWSSFMYRGFVMSSTVKGKGECSKPDVEIGVQHVNCTEDAAAFVALAAAVDLSVDACRSFTHKLRKELRHQSQNSVV